jgi:hypothetical protein
LKDVLHLSLYPIGAGVFAGAVFALAVSAVVSLLVAVGYIPDIKYDPTRWWEFDPTQWWKAKDMTAGIEWTLHECRREESLIYTILATGAQEAYQKLRPPIGSISFLRPVTTLLYLILAARIFMAAIDRRKPVVFGVVLLAALVATGANILSHRAYFAWNYENSGCEENLAKRAFDRVAEPVLKKFAADLDRASKDDDLWDVSVRAEGRMLLYTYRFKKPINMEAFPLFVSRNQEDALQVHCSDAGWYLRSAKATETHTYYNFKGERLTSFSIGPADCPSW